MVKLLNLQFCLAFSPAYCEQAMTKRHPQVNEKQANTRFNAASSLDLYKRSYCQQLVETAHLITRMLFICSFFWLRLISTEHRTFWFVGWVVFYIYEFVSYERKTRSGGSEVSVSTSGLRSSTGCTDRCVDFKRGTSHSFTSTCPIMHAREDT